MAAGLRSLLAWWLGGASANPEVVQTDALCFGSVSVYPAIHCAAKAYSALDAEGDTRPALHCAARGYAAMDAEGDTRPALAGVVSATCKC